eukprot:c28305_g1_i1 orf=2-310(-)
MVLAVHFLERSPLFEALHMRPFDSVAYHHFLEVSCARDPVGEEIRSGLEQSLFLMVVDKRKVVFRSHCGFKLKVLHKRGKVLLGKRPFFSSTPDSSQGEVYIP